MNIGVPYETMEVVSIFSDIVSFGFKKENFEFNFKRYALIPCRIKFKKRREKLKKIFFFIYLHERGYTLIYIH